MGYSVKKWSDVENSGGQRLRGGGIVSLDAKGRLAIPSRIRERLQGDSEGALVLTVNPMDRALWLYPMRRWETIELKLDALSDFERESRRIKQVMQGYAEECRCDAGGRLLIPQTLRGIAGLKNQVALLGQGHRIELWDEKLWTQQMEQWLRETRENRKQPSEALQSLSL